MNSYIPPASIARIIVKSIPELYWVDTHSSWVRYEKFTSKSVRKKILRPFLWTNHAGVFKESEDFIIGLSHSIYNMGLQPIIFPHDKPLESTDALISVDTEFTLKRYNPSSTISICPKLCGPCQNCFVGIKMQIKGNTP